MKPFPLSSYRQDRDVFIARATRWNLIRLYVLVFSLPLLVVGTAYAWTVYQDVSRNVDPVAAVAVESSRPLNEQDKAPADWTGDGVADGWLLGEWLPGQEGVVYLVDGVQVSKPFGAGEHVATGLLGLITVGSLTAILGFILFDPLDRLAWRAAERDWREAVRLGNEQGWGKEGVPLWV